MAERLVWTGYAAAACAALPLPVYVYYGLGGDVGAAAGPSLQLLPDWLPATAAEVAWRTAQLGIAALLGAVAVLAVALVRPWGRRLPTAALVVPAFGVVVLAVGYAFSGLVGLVGRAAPEALRGAAALGEVVTGHDLAGAFSGDVGPAGGYADWLAEQPLSAYPLAGPALFGPWALALGLLLALAVTYRLGGPTARRIWLVAVALGVLRLAL